MKESGDLILRDLAVPRPTNTPYTHRTTDRPTTGPSVTPLGPPRPYSSGVRSSRRRRPCFPPTHRSSYPATGHLLRSLRNRWWFGRSEGRRIGRPDLARRCCGQHVHKSRAVWGWGEGVVLGVNVFSWHIYVYMAYMECLGYIIVVQVDI